MNTNMIPYIHFQSSPRVSSRSGGSNRISIRIDLLRSMMSLIPLNTKMKALEIRNSASSQEKREADMPYSFRI
jgi:hypothetical protein